MLPLLLLVLLLISPDVTARMITSEEFDQYIKSHNITHQAGVAFPVNPCEKFVKGTGIPCELHQIETEDGFELLTIHLPNHYKTKSVLFVHGLMSCSNTWLLGDNVAKAFALRAWTAGFDIWIPNSRGNQYSLTKKGEPITDEKFWKSVDWDLMAKYDVPAYLDYINEKKPGNKIAYVGHSQGTVQAFAAMSMNYGNIQDRVSLFVGMAPVGRVGQQRSHELTAMVNMKLDKIFQLFGIDAFPPFNTSAVDILKKLHVKCDTTESQLCNNIIYDIAGATPAYVDKLTLELVGFVPSTTSVHNLNHWMQAIRGKQFQAFDFGTIGNWIHYKQATPPLYQPSKIQKIPIALYSGGKDVLADPDDVAWLESQISPDLLKIHKKLPDYQHGDFLWADTAPKLIWEEVLSNIEGL